jgi:uncharacterized repeat protein (TIGR03803 family)
VATLTHVGSVLYGTTSNGGGTGCHQEGCGTIFSVTTSGNEQVVYRFQGYAKFGDGSFPEAHLNEVGGTLYGTTVAGGTHNDGTIFSLKP